MWLEEIFKGGTEGIFAGIKGIITTVKADPLEVMKLQQAITTAEMSMTTALSQAQTRINEIEAMSQDKFTSRWRPAMGWICVIGFGYATLLQPLGTWVCNNLQVISPPQLDTTVLMPLVTGMLGLAGYRTYEKTRNGK